MRAAKQASSKFFVLVLLACGCTAGLQAQLPPVDSPFPGQPSSAQACSVEATCAELAPTLIKRALASTSLAPNLGNLASALNGYQPRTSEQGANIAVAALRAAHADDVHVESFTDAIPRNHGFQPTKLTSQNVVATVHGREDPREFLLVGTPLPLPSSGNNLRNACNAALLIDAVRAIETSGSIPRREIRFVFFPPSGVEAYLQKHRDELNGMVAAVLFDEGCSPIRAYSLGGRRDFSSALREALAPIKPLATLDFVTEPEEPSAGLDFILEGIPTVAAQAGASPASDKAPIPPQKIDIESLKRDVAIASITAYAIADNPSRIGNRQARPQVEQTVTNSGIAAWMQSAGIWRNWRDHRLGLP